GGFPLQLISPALPPIVVPAGTPYKMIVLDVDDGGYNSAQSTFTEEMQIQYLSPDSRFNAVLGGYLEFSRPLGISSAPTGIFLDCDRPSDPSSCSNPLFIGNIS